MRPPRTRSLLPQVLRTPLGRLTMSAFLRDSAGIGFPEPRLLGSFAAVYMLDGLGTFADPRRKVEVHPGDLLLLFPDVEHSYRHAPGHHWDELYFVFDGPIFELLRKQGVLSPERPIIHLEPVEYWLPRWQGIVCEQGGAVSPLTAVGRLVELLCAAADVSRAGARDSQDRQWLAKACTLLEEKHDGQALSLAGAAEAMNMSYVAFRKRFARLAEESPGRYRVRRAIDRACQMLYASPDLANKQVARACGFASEYHFSRRFKQILGISPRQFRSQIR